MGQGPNGTDDRNRFMMPGLGMPGVRVQEDDHPSTNPSYHFMTLKEKSCYRLLGWMWWTGSSVQISYSMAQAEVPPTIDLNDSHM